MSFKLSSRSLRRLEGVHPDLVVLVKEAIRITSVDFSVVEGVRTLATQRRYFELGKSRTMNSRHLTGHAVDLAPWVNGQIDWENSLGYNEVARAMKLASKYTFDASEINGIPVQWGYDLWQWDKPHFQLPWNEYPA